MKVKPPPEYPPEDKSYPTGNHPSCCCMYVTLHVLRLPDWMQALVKVGVESGTVLAGYVQTENIGIEKIVCNGSEQHGY